MKNREKYADKIIKMVFGSETCDFMKDVVLPGYVGGREYSEDFCSTNSCEGCSKLFAFWLDEEYEEPEVDWNKVPVDTLVRVRNRDDGGWVLRYFKEIGDEHMDCRYFTWMGGTTSKTAKGHFMCWKYCELVEDEDGNPSI